MIASFAGPGRALAVLALCATSFGGGDAFQNRPRWPPAVRKTPTRRQR
jgi:hypothetical protein